MKIIEKSGFLQKFKQKCEKSLTNFCEDFEFGAVRRSMGSSSLVFFEVFREVFLQVVFHLGFQRCEGMQIL